MSILPQVAEKTLLEKARESRPARYTHIMVADVPQRIDLALAYVAGEITGIQAANAMGVNPHNIAQTLGKILMRGIRSGMLKIEKVSR